MINTGWSGGAYGTGKRMKLAYTRSMITAALTGKLNTGEFTQDPIFGLFCPTSCQDVPSELLNPRNTWADKADYDMKALKLAALFNKNFEKYKDKASAEILNASPKTA